MHKHDTGELCQVSQHNERYVQASIASLGFAHRKAYCTSLHPSSFREPRHPSLQLAENGCGTFAADSVGFAVESVGFAAD